MESTYVCDRLSSGSPSTRAFQILLVGKTWQPPMTGGAAGWAGPAGASGGRPGAAAMPPARHSSAMIVASGRDLLSGVIGPQPVRTGAGSAGPVSANAAAATAGPGASWRGRAGGPGPDR